MTLLTILPDIAFGILNVVFSWIPVLSWPASFLSSCRWFITFTAGANYFIDLPLAITAMLWILVLYNISRIFQFFNLVLSFFPFINRRK